MTVRRKRVFAEHCFASAFDWVSDSFEICTHFKSTEFLTDDGMPVVGLVPITWTDSI